MTAEECTRLMLGAIPRRRRELVMTLHGQVGQCLKLIAPGLVNRMAFQAIKIG